MKLPTSEVPQADNIEALAKAVQSVADGARTYHEIADALGYAARQGSYYRTAGQILGFLKKVERNDVKVTATGRAYLRAKGKNKKEILTQAVLNARVFQRIIPFLESKHSTGLTRAELESFIGSVTHTTAKMIKRRTHTIIAWLEAINMLGPEGNKFVLKPLPEFVPLIQYTHDEEPLLPRKFELREYSFAARRSSQAKEFIRYEVKQARRDRANEAHIRLTNLVADKVRRAGSIPRRNRLIDLAAQINRKMFLFEIKSSTPRNLTAQIRKGVSQLYEYRYLQGIPKAKLVLVVENPLTPPIRWAADYLIKDRGIFLVWDADEDNLHCLKETRSALSFLL